MAEQNKGNLKEFLKKNQSILWIGFIIVALIAGFFIGGLLEPKTDLQKGPQLGAEKISNEKQADEGTTDLGNKISGASGSIEKIIDKVK